MAELACHEMLKELSGFLRTIGACIASGTLALVRCAPLVFSEMETVHWLKATDTLATTKSPACRLYGAFIRVDEAQAQMKTNIVKEGKFSVPRLSVDAKISILSSDSLLIPIHLSLPTAGQDPE